MGFAVPALTVMFIILFFVLRITNRIETAAIGGIRDYLITRRLGLGRWSRGEANTLIAFGAAILLWTAPAIIALLFGEKSPHLKTYNRILPEGVVAIIAAALLFMLPVNWRKREFTLTWGDATRIDWGTVLLFGCGIALGTLSTTTGLAAKIGDVLQNATGLESRGAIVLAAAALGIFVSELTSNTASATVVIPVIIALAQKVGIDPVGPAIAACLGSSYGFMLPVSTAPNAMAYGTGMVPITRMAKSGLLFDIAGLFVIWATVMIAFK